MAKGTSCIIMSPAPGAPPAAAWAKAGVNKSLLLILRLKLAPAMTWPCAAGEYSQGTRESNGARSWEGDDGLRGPSRAEPESSLLPRLSLVVLRSPERTVDIPEFWKLLQSHILHSSKA